MLPEGFAHEDAPQGDGTSSYWHVWNGFLEPDREGVDLRREVTVVLTGGEGEGAPAGCAHRLSGGDFLPRTMVVRAGEQLRVVNTDGIVYELVSSDLPGFAPATTQPGNALRTPVAAGGPYTLHDRNLPHVRGFVLPVADLAACGEVTRDGRVDFGDVAPGTYTLRAFRDGAEIAHAEVQVQPLRGRREQDLDPLTLPAPGTE